MARHAPPYPGLPRNVTPPMRSPAAYVAAHWGGELSLVAAFWLGSLWAWGVPALTERLLADVIEAPDRPLATLLAVATAWAVAIVVEVWLNVGIWRSARRHVSRGGRRFWAVAAQLAAIGGIGYCGVELTMAPPWFAQQIAVVVEGDDDEPPRVRLVRYDTEL